MRTRPAAQGATARPKLDWAVGRGPAGAKSREVVPTWRNQAEKVAPQTIAKTRLPASPRLPTNFIPSACMANAPAATPIRGEIISIDSI